MTIGELTFWMSSYSAGTEAVVYNGQTGEVYRIKFITNNREIYNDLTSPEQFIISIATPPIKHSAGGAWRCPHGKALFDRCDECVDKEVKKVSSLPDGYGEDTE